MMFNFGENTGFKRNKNFPFVAQLKRPCKTI